MGTKGTKNGQQEPQGWSPEFRCALCASLRVLRGAVWGSLPQGPLADQRVHHNGHQGHKGESRTSRSEAGLETEDPLVFFVPVVVEGFVSVLSALVV